MEIESPQYPVGVFGLYDSLTLHATETLTAKKVLAQDLAGEEAVDITSRCAVDRSRLRIPGSLLREIGTMAQSAGDLSLPGLVVRVV